MGRYRMIYYEGRAVLYIHKRHPIAIWSQNRGADWCIVTFKELNVLMFTVYSPNRDQDSWDSPLSHLAVITP